MPIKYTVINAKKIPTNITRLTTRTAFTSRFCAFQPCPFYRELPSSALWAIQIISQEGNTYHSLTTLIQVTHLREAGY